MVTNRTNPTASGANSKLPARRTKECTRRDGATDTKCRCSQECITLASRARRMREERAKKRRQNPRVAPGQVPVRPVILHIRAYLNSKPGATISSMSKESGVPARTLGKIVEDYNRNPLRMTRLPIAQAILRTPLGTPDVANALVPGHGTRRRVEALGVQGWTLGYIAEKCGVSVGTLSRDNTSTTVRAETASKVAELYAQLRFKQGPSRIAESRAKALGYIPGWAWNRNIDDPMSAPDLSSIEDQKWLASIFVSNPKLKATRYARFYAVTA